MGTWVSALVETGGRSDFWELARGEGVSSDLVEVPRFARIDGSDVAATFALAEALSKKLGTSAVAFCAQSSADVYELRGYQAGECVRKLAYSRDDGGWLTLEGTQQPWEAAFFFDDAAANPEDDWPDLLSDEASDEELARYRAAREARDASEVMDLLGPHSLAPLHRLAAHLGVDGSAPPHGALRGKGSLLKKLFGR